MSKNRWNGLYALCLLLVAAVFGGAGTAAFAQEDATLLQAAQKEGTVVFYTSKAAAEVEAFSKAFNEKYPGIKVEVFHLTGAPLSERFFADAARGAVVADVITHGAPEMQEFADAGLLAPYENKGFTSEVASGSSGLEPYGYIDQISTVAIGYNSQKISSEEAAGIKSWADLANPKWKNRLVLVDPSATTSHFQYYAALYKAMGKEAFQKWLTDLAANTPTVLDSNTPSVDGILRGEFDLGIVSEVTIIRNMSTNKSAPLGIIYLDPTPAQYNMTALVKNAPHPNAAKLFMDFLYSKDGQELWMQLYGARSPRKDAVNPNASLAGFVPTEKLDLITWQNWDEPTKIREEVLGIFRDTMR